MPVSFHPPSLYRLLRVISASHKISILRHLEYERLSQLALSGLVLDFGGGAEVRYTDIVNKWGDAVAGFKYESANIDPNANPTYQLEPNEKIPVEDERFDAVISLNTFEHIYNLSQTIDELHRVLKAQGDLIFAVPFIFMVHGHPDDYHRGTPSFWRKILIEHGFDQIEIEALTWGPLSVGQTVSGIPGPFKHLRRCTALCQDLLLFWINQFRNRGDSEVISHLMTTTPLGYFVVARKN